ncbi:hypothetical protein EDS67_21700 [candidate division KSB1 bacterium]|nr:MAG: hypothetical protein EDS67_21700 [candidate division KSB1 bacterium]MBC6950934.1 hypothetical protein [candidate division KSB1 bacterium]MCE7944145.1 hypothetical protein [Chlorobi bacterium CHB1]
MLFCFRGRHFNFWQLVPNKCRDQCEGINRQDQWESIVRQREDESQIALDSLAHAFDQPPTRYQTGTPLGDIELGLQQRVFGDSISNHR